RVFAYRGMPTGKEGDRFPAVLHIHGGGQTAWLQWVRFWTRRGYECVSYDFCGKVPGRGEDVVTDWGATPGYWMADPAVARSSVRPTPKHSAWYHWTLVARRGLTLLEQSPRVDADRMGVFGIS